MLSNGAVETADLVVVGVGVAPRVKLAGRSWPRSRQRRRRRRAACGQASRGLRRRGHRLGLAPVFRAPPPRRALGQRAQPGEHSRRSTRLVAATPTTGCHISSPINTTSAWSTSATPIPDDAVVVRGSLADREFIAFWQRDGAVTAAMNVNVWDVVDDLKAMITGGRPIDAAGSPIPASPSPASSARTCMPHHQRLSGLGRGRHTTTQRAIVSTTRGATRTPRHRVRWRLASEPRPAVHSKRTHQRPVQRRDSAPAFAGRGAATRRWRPSREAARGGALPMTPGADQIATATASQAPQRGSSDDVSTARSYTAGGATR